MSAFAVWWIIAGLAGYGFAILYLAREEKNDKKKEQQL